MPFLAPLLEQRSPLSGAAHAPQWDRQRFRNQKSLRTSMRAPTMDVWFAIHA